MRAFWLFVVGRLEDMILPVDIDTCEAEGISSLVANYGMR
jgi:hypothetical protein